MDSNNNKRQLPWDGYGVAASPGFSGAKKKPLISNIGTAPTTPASGIQNDYFRNLIKCRRGPAAKPRTTTKTAPRILVTGTTIATTTTSTTTNGEKTMLTKLSTAPTPYRQNLEVKFLRPSPERSHSYSIQPDVSIPEPVGLQNPAPPKSNESYSGQEQSSSSMLAIITKKLEGLEAGLREQQNVQEAKLDEILQKVQQCQQQQDTHGLILRKVVGVIQVEVEQIKDVVCEKPPITTFTLPDHFSVTPMSTENDITQFDQKLADPAYMKDVSSWLHQQIVELVPHKRMNEAKDILFTPPTVKQDIQMKKGGLME